jgi:uncharacterized protein YndB with AHSA1/START domain
MTTTSADELVYRRIHQASPALLFDCMTAPDHLSHFWGPTGTSTPLDRIRVDVRPGGVFETTMVGDADGSEYTMRAVYQEVERPTKLSWMEPDSGMSTSITFTDRGDGSTEVVTRQRNVPAPYRSPEAQAGFATSLDRFDVYVASLSGTANSAEAAS